MSAPIIAALLMAATAAAPPPPPATPEAAHRAGRAAEAAGDEDAGRRLYQRGVDLARATLARSPDDPGALLWYTANLAGEALTHGKLYTLRVIPEIERTLLRLERVAPLYDHAAAARVLGRLYHKAPAVISIGSDAKARRYLTAALARAPDFPGNQAFAAELFADEGDCGTALPLAERLLAARDLDRYGPDAREWRDLAQAAAQECR